MQIRKTTSNNVTSLVFNISYIKEIRKVTINSAGLHFSVAGYIFNPSVTKTKLRLHLYP